jgi:hypothetical protein
LRGLLLLFVQSKRWMTLPLPKTSLGMVIAFVTFFPAKTWAQAPRDYLNTPVNAAAFFVDFLGTNSETAAESDLPLPNNVAVIIHRGRGAAKQKLLMIRRLALW